MKKTIYSMVVVVGLIVVLIQGTVLAQEYKILNQSDWDSAKANFTQEDTVSVGDDSHAGVSIENSGSVSLNSLTLLNGAAFSHSGGDNDTIGGGLTVNAGTSFTLESGIKSGTIKAYGEVLIDGGSMTADISLYPGGVVRNESNDNIILTINGSSRLWGAKNSIKQLAEPSDLKWEGKIAQWTRPENAGDVQISLYKDGVFQKQVDGTSTGTSYDFSRDMYNLGEGEYQFTAKAMGRTASGTTYLPTGETPLEDSPVYEYVQLGPDVTVQPSDVIVREGETATFSIKATGRKLSYQWIVREEGKEWKKVTEGTGANTDTYKVKTSLDMDGQLYACIVTNPVSDRTSLSATLHVAPAIIIPDPKDNAISGIKNGQKVTQGKKLKFTAVGAGMDNTAPKEQDERYQPRNYQIASLSGTWEDAPYTGVIDTSDMEPGEYTLTVEYEWQRYERHLLGGPLAWYDVNDGDPYTKSVTFKVVEKNSPSGSDNTGGKSGNSTSGTGDEITLQFWMVMIMVTGMAVIIVSGYRMRFAAKKYK